MADERNTDHSEQTISHHPGVESQNLPLQEREQPDPMLQLSAGRLGPGSLTLVGVAIAAIIVVVFYGLSRPSAEHATTPPAASSAPAPGGNPGAAPAATPAAPPSSTSGGH
jgi:hypothetical protein